MHIDLDHLAATSRLIGDPLRLLILRLLMEGELCVCEITAAIEEPQYKVSRHLGILKRTGLLRDRREGTWILYRFDPELPAPWRRLLETLKSMLDADPRVTAVVGRLKPSPKRLAAPCTLCHAPAPSLPAIGGTSR
jgi:ArsR family transcriptional regulator